MKANRITAAGLGPRQVIQALLLSGLMTGLTAQAQWTNYIELEDYNFEGGKFISDATTGMDGPYVGGVYSNRVAIMDVDFKVTSFRGGTTAAFYRQADYDAGIYTSPRNQAVNADRGYFSTTYNFKTAWQDPGEWQNYTRVFSNAVYSVSIYAGANNGTGVRMTLETVTSDPTQAYQTTVTNGYFVGPDTGGVDVYAPLEAVDGLGLPLRIRLAGTNTLRLTQRLYSNIDYLKFVAIENVTAMPPYVAAASPAPNATLGGASAPVDLLIRAGDFPLDDTKVRLILGGTDVTTASSIYPGSEPGTTTVHYDFSSTSSMATSITVRLIYADTGSPVTWVTNDWSFAVPGNQFFIEAEDFNYDGGQFISDASNGMNGPYGGGAYFGFNAVTNVDYVSASSGDPMDDYRSAVAGVTFLRFPYWGYKDSSRGLFDLYDNQDFMLIWCEAGDWQNYTRTFNDSGCYTVMLRAGAPALARAELGMVTSNPAQPGQTVRPLGQFALTGIDNVHQYSASLTDLFGQPRVVRLNGTTTLRLTELGKIYPNYLSLEKASEQVIVPWVSSVSPNPGQVVYSNTPIQVTITRGDNALNLGSVRLWFNSTDVTSAATLSGNGDGGATVSYQGYLTPGATGAVTVAFADTASQPNWTTNTWSFSRFSSSTGSLYIEAEDFNFNGGGFISDACNGMEGFYTGNSYFGSNAVPNVDYFAAATGTAMDEYRSSVADVSFLRFPYWGYKDSQREGFEIPDNRDFMLIWCEPGDWQNYTRNFYDSGCYVVQLRAAAPPSETRWAELGIVTSNPASTGQTVVPVGRFGLAGEDNVHQYTATMSDALGQPRFVRLNGITTLRLTELGSVYPNYLKFMKTNDQVIAPMIASVTPAPGQALDSQPAISLGIVKGDRNLNPATVRVWFNGIDMSAFTTVTPDSSGGAAIQCTNYYVLPGATANVTVVYADDGAPATWTTNTWSLSRVPYPTGTLFIEAEDFNYGNGQFVESGVGMDGPYTGGSYAGFNATLNVDYYSSAGGTTVDDYRAGLADIAFLRFPYWGYKDSSRGAWEIPDNQDYMLIWSEAGDWQNYTRVFPEGWYAVFLRSGGPADYRSELSLVTSDPTQPRQTTHTVGRFYGVTTGDNVHQASSPLSDASGRPVTLHLSGTNTFRLTEVTPNHAGFIYFVPVPPANARQGAFAQLPLSMSKAGGTITLRWSTFGWRLQSSTNVVEGDWTDVPGGTTSPVTIPSTEVKFFRLVQ